MSTRPTIVLLPGLLCDASIWEAQRAALAPHAEIRIADFSQLDSIDAMARSALGLADGPLIAIGHSMGARVAMEMVRLAPGRIEKLALIDTGVDSRRDGEAEKRQILIDLAFAEGMEALAERWLPPMLHEGRVGDQALLAPLKAMVMRATPEQHHRQIKALLNRPNVRPHLEAIACPTLVMVGRQDRWSPLAQHEEMASLIPNAELVVIEDSGHMSLLEQPEQVSRALLRFLGFEKDHSGADRAALGEVKPMGDDAVPDRIPDTPLFDRKRSLQGYRINKMAMGLGDPANREAFRENESAYLDRFGLTPEEKEAVMTRNWREMVRLGGNLFFILKISAVDPVRITEIGAHQAGMEHADFLRDRLGKK
ncbi:alpha/beta fold hydrolase [Microvirga yunnanensis]|uniref:alpha/beta fold hydrolase n=1 Tax=Microvirga yunnanensis TaxID=2953740 RepID=UPI0021C6BD14|nr:alpha/beta fold hydrolase [Microvirga sp. HBU65207]